MLFDASNYSATTAALSATVESATAESAAAESTAAESQHTAAESAQHSVFDDALPLQATARAATAMIAKIFFIFF